ncbi:MAG: hypothetical protein COB50_02100 [Thiotrichales bacterium]|nr:MAG: hypothetical protein COB50_02100 [Thiotrichales bacterium]
MAVKHKDGNTAHSFIEKFVTNIENISADDSDVFDTKKDVSSKNGASHVESSSYLCDQDDDTDSE